ncbi:MAG: hypothetical protein IJJ74_03150 [Eubacterium sp.]|nr:hypothetical protein [Eubacterium sp.]
MELEKEKFRVASVFFIFAALVDIISLIMFKPEGQKGIDIYDGFSKVLMIFFASIAIVLAVLRYNRLIISSMALYCLIKSVAALAKLDKYVNIFKNSVKSDIKKNTKFSIKAYELFSPLSGFSLLICTVLIISFAVIVIFTMYRKPVIPLMVVFFFYMVATLFAEGLYIINTMKDKELYKDFWKQNIIMIIWSVFEWIMICLALLLTREPFKKERVASRFNPDEDDKRREIEEYGEIREIKRRN